MEVNKSYIKFLLQLLNKEENINMDKHQEELMVNLYLTLLSLSNIEYSENIFQKEKETISDFLRKLNNLKVKIQLKRKIQEIEKLSEEIITQYYENISILSLYIEDCSELENIINSKEPKKITELIDSATKDKMEKEERKEDLNQKRLELIKLLPTSNYYINDHKIYIKADNSEEEITIKEFLEIFNYLLITDNYNKLYTNKNNQTSHELIINNIIKLLITKEKNKIDIEKILIPTIITYLLSLKIDKEYELDTSNFNIENIKITELYSLASKEQSKDNIKTPKWRNISIPNEYLIDKLKDMIKNGMYYYKEDTFILEKIENKISDFKVSINIQNIKKFLTDILKTTI